MELDEFKMLTREKPVKLVHQRGFLDLEGMISKNSTGIVEKIKRNLALEFVFAIVFIVFDSYMVLKYESIHIKGFGIVMLIFCMWFMFYLRSVYKRIRRQESNELSIKANLHIMISIIEGFTRLYFQLTMFLLPITFFSGLLIGYFNRISFQQDGFPLISSNEIYIYVGAFVAWSVMIFVFTKWYLKKLYGNHVENLRGHLRELENTQEDA